MLFDNPETLFQKKMNTIQDILIRLGQYEPKEIGQAIYLCNQKTGVMTKEHGLDVLDFGINYLYPKIIEPLAKIADGSYRIKSYDDNQGLILEEQC